MKMNLLTSALKCAILTIVACKIMYVDLVSIGTSVSHRISVESDSRRFEHDLKFPSTLLIPSGYLIIMCQDKKCNSPKKLFMHYPDRKRIGHSDYTRPGDHQMHLNLSHIAVAFIGINSEMYLGNYKCMCYDRQWAGNENKSLENTDAINAEHIVGSIDVLYSPCVMPKDDCSNMDNCTKQLSQLMGCVLLHESIKGQKCQQLTAEHCRIHAFGMRIPSNLQNFVVCTIVGKQYSSVCEAVSSANKEMSLPILYIKHDMQCPSKNEDDVFPNAIYRQQVNGATECDMNYKYKWKLVPLQSYVLAIMYNAVILCYVCHEANLRVIILDDPMYQQIHESSFREVLCKHTGKSWVATVSFLAEYKFTGAVSTSHVKVHSRDSYVDVMYVIEPRAIRATITRPSVIRHGSHLGCDQSYSRLRNYPANGYVAYELEYPEVKSTIYSEMKSRGTTYEIIVSGLQKCTVKFRSCYYRTENNTLTQSTVETYAEITSDLSRLYLTLAITAISVLILSVLIFVLINLWKKHTAKRKFLYLTGGSTDTHDKYRSDSYKAEKPHRSISPSVSPQFQSASSPISITKVAKIDKKKSSYH